MKTSIGILGGMGPASGCMLFEKIIRSSPAQIDQDHLSVVILSDPDIPDRNDAVWSCHGLMPLL